MNLPLVPKPALIETHAEPGLVLPKDGKIPVTECLSSQISSKEGYQLRIASDQVEITAAEQAGLLYARQTLNQLTAAAKRGDGQIPALQIEDAPRFSWRGAHLDVCRHFFSINTIERFIDQLAAHKLNVFHWHLTEDQGWRLEIKKYPRLTEIGAWRQSEGSKPYGGFYTQEEASHIVAYAAERHITVVPEIEIPGHAVAALAAYPELGCLGKPMEVETTWGIFDDVYCPGRESVFEFLESVLDEVCEIFPSTYIHVGGDECPKTRWIKCPRCQQRIKEENLADEEALQSYTIRRIEQLLIDRGRRMIGWDEILEGGLAPQATVMSWRGTEGGVAAAREGHDVIMTPNSHCYLDHKQIDSEDETVGRPMDVCTLENCYSFDPVPPDFTSAESAYVLGSQANHWTEYIRNQDELDYAAFPRLCALAEVFWSPNKERRFDEFTPRLKGHLKKLASEGIRYCGKDPAIS